MKMDTPCKIIGVGKLHKGGTVFKKVSLIGVSALCSFSASSLHAGDGARPGRFHLGVLNILNKNTIICIYLFILQLKQISHSFYVLLINQNLRHTGYRSVLVSGTKQIKFIVNHK